MWAFQNTFESNICKDNNQYMLYKIKLAFKNEVTFQTWQINQQISLNHDINRLLLFKIYGILKKYYIS